MANRAVELLGIAGLLTSAAALAASWSSPAHRAVLLMAWGLIATWVVFLGGLSYRYRDKIRSQIQRLPGSWQLKFFSLFLAGALLEEAVTTSMTNLAPIFGAPHGSAYITASGNYLDVVTFHSVIVFLPMIAAWTWLVNRYRYTPVQVFVLWGLTGWIMEIGFSGPSQVGAIGFWVFIYGLMAWPAAYASLPDERPAARDVRWYDLVLPFPVAALSLVLFATLASLAAAISGYNPYAGHPGIHFPPISS